MKKIAFIIATGLTLFGCQEKVEVVEAEDPPVRVIEFKGKPDPRFVGKWKDSRAEVFYELNADGSYKYYGTVTSPGGVHKLDAKGKWGVEADKIYFDDSKSVADSSIQLKGADMVLKTLGQVKIETVYKKL